jgi:type IV secretory pathway VirB10-like protein
MADQNPASAPGAADQPPTRAAKGMTPRNILNVAIFVFIGVVLVSAVAMQMRVNAREEKLRAAPKKVEVGEAPSPVEIEKMASEQRQRAIQAETKESEASTGVGTQPSVIALAGGRPDSGPQSLQSLGAAGNSPTARTLVQGRTSDGNFLAPPRSSDFGGGDVAPQAPQVGDPSVTSPILMQGAKGNPAAEAARAVRDIASGQAPDFRAIAASVPNIDPAALMAQMRPQAPQSTVEQNQSFLREAKQTPSRQRAIRADLPEAQIIILEGTVIQAVTESAINSDLPGQIRAKVTQDIYDSIKGNVLVIPKGARLIGTYNANIANAQSRILMVFNRLILPDGRSLDLQGMAGGEPNGTAGLTGDINHHFLRNFGSGFLVAGLTYALGRRDPQVNITVNTTGSQPASISSAAGQILVDTAKSAIETYKQPKPTITIDSGSVFSILVQRDMIVENKENAILPRRHGVFEALTVEKSR